MSKLRNSEKLNRLYFPSLNKLLNHRMKLKSGSHIVVIVVIIGNASINSKHQHPPGLTPGEFFKVVKFPAPGQKIFAKFCPPGQKNRQKPRPWGQFCGLSRQFCHDREIIRMFLVLFFSLAFFEFFQRL